MKILSFDPAGNFGKEGYGTTGVCGINTWEDSNGDKHRVTILDEIKATEYGSEVDYWQEHIGYIRQCDPEHLVVEGYKLYNHKGKAASMQANSTLQTPQLIGAIKLIAFQMGIPLTIQYASDVKTRWSEDVLVKLGYLEQKGNRYYYDGKLTSTHKRDSLKHALHFERYKLKELMK